MFIAQIVGALVSANGAGLRLSAAGEGHGQPRPVGRAGIAAHGGAFALAAAGIDKLPPSALWAGVVASALDCVFAAMEQNGG